MLVTLATMNAIGVLILVHQAVNFPWVGHLERIDGSHWCVVNVFHVKFSLTSCHCVAIFHSADERNFEERALKLKPTTYMYVNLGDMSEMVKSFTNHPLAQMNEFHNYAVITISKPFKLKPEQIMPLFSFNRSLFYDELVRLDFLTAGNSTVTSVTFIEKDRDLLEFSMKPLSRTDCEDIVKMTERDYKRTHSNTEVNDSVSFEDTEDVFMCFEDIDPGNASCPSDSGAVVVFNGSVWGMSNKKRDRCGKQTHSNRVIRVYTSIDKCLNFLTLFRNMTIDTNPTAMASQLFLGNVDLSLFVALAINFFV